MFRNNLIFIISIIVYCYSTAIFSSESSNQDTGSFNFFVFTDMHLDIHPKADTTIINPPSNTYLHGDIDKVTFDKLMDKISGENLANKYKPNFIISLGDINAHNASRYKGYRQSELSTAYLKLGQTFPASPIFNVFGNNDSPDKDYGDFLKNGNSPYTTLMGQAGWKNGFLSSGTLCVVNTDHPTYPCINTPSDENKENGYFTAYLQKDLKLIALNSVLFSSSQYNPSHLGADAELAWLNAELQSSMKNTENVIIGMHIPVGSQWLDEYNDKFSTIISKIKPGVIIAMLAGHTHMNELRAIRLVDAKRKTLDVFPLIITPAIAPANNNAPGFQNFMLKKNNNQWVIQDIVAYSFQQKLAADPITLIEYYKFNDSYCPGEQTTVSACLKKNLGFTNHSTFIKAPASYMMSSHYTNGNLNNLKEASAHSWVRSYEVVSQY